MPASATYGKSPYLKVRPGPEQFEDPPTELPDASLRPLQGGGVESDVQGHGDFVGWPYGHRRFGPGQANGRVAVQLSWRPRLSSPLLGRSEAWPPAVADWASGASLQEER